MRQQGASTVVQETKKKKKMMKKMADSESVKYILISRQLAKAVLETTAKLRKE